MKTYRDYIKDINKEELKAFYENHTTGQACEEFNVPTLQIMKTILKKFDIPLHTISESTSIQMSTMTEQQKVERGNKISSGNTGREVSQETRIKISLAQKGKPRTYQRGERWEEQKFKKGNVAWNKGLKGVQHWVEGQGEQIYETKLRNGTLGKFKTSFEIKVENDLIDKYGAEHVFYQYKDLERYPFFCDFYVDTEDLFIEVNAWWHHGPHPYDPNNIEDVKLLNHWIEQSELYPDKKQFKEAIRIWTEIDPLKIQTAKENNLNYITIYP